MFTSREAVLVHQNRVGRVERAIGVIYRPETELQGHSSRAVPPRRRRRSPGEENLSSSAP
jgi:hypothetical protein